MVHQLLSLEFADHDESRGFPLGAQWDVMPLGGPLFSLFRYDELPFEERWGAALHDLTETTLGHAFDWGVGIEDLPHESNTVTLDPELTDSAFQAGSKPNETMVSTRLAPSTQANRSVVDVTLAKEAVRSARAARSAARSG